MDEKRDAAESKIAPPPPAPDIEIRTMKSDVESIKESGGDATTIKPLKQENEDGENGLKIIIFIIGIFAASVAIGYLVYFLAAKLFS